MTSPSDDLELARQMFLIDWPHDTWEKHQINGKPDLAARRYIAMAQAPEITRLRAELAAMEDCKNTYATLAYERQEQLFKLRAELAEAEGDAITLRAFCKLSGGTPSMMQARAEQAEAALAEAKQEVERLEKLVYVPGLLKCAKCGCSVISTNLHYPSGGFSADNHPKECPNGCGPMWRVTERDAGNDIVGRCEAKQKRAEQAERDLAEALAQRDQAITNFDNLAVSFQKAEAARDRFAAVIALHHSSNTDRRLALKSLPTYADEKAATDEAVAHHRAAQGGK